MKHPGNHLLYSAVAAGVMMVATPAFANDNKFEKMDADGDGVITSVESDMVARDMHQRMDGDGDGRVTAVEMKAAHEAKAREKGKTHDKDDAHYNEMVREMDADNDGAVSIDEYAATAREKHGEGDANDDGNVTRAEFDASMEKARDRHSAGH